MSGDTLDDWAVCEALISEAILEIENGGPVTPDMEPWGGYFSKETRRIVYGRHELEKWSDPEEAN
jgi:hypothetical protein